MTSESGTETGPAETGPAETLIRRAGPDDWEVYRATRLASLGDSPQAFSSTLEREAVLHKVEWRDRLDSAACFLAWRDGQAIGTAASLPYDRRYKHGQVGARMLVAMWVAPRARGLGVAGQLVEVVADHASAEGAPAIVLWVYEDNIRARALYERTGFRETGVREPRPRLDDEWELLLIRELS
jgi:GNAT superfamily N-acetyltransferase